MTMPRPREVFRIRPRLNDILVLRVHPDDLEMMTDDEVLSDLADGFGRDVRVLVMATHHPIEITAVDPGELPEVPTSETPPA